MKKEKMYWLKILLLYLFIFSLPYEYYDPFGISTFFTIAKMLGIAYFGLALLDIKRNFSLVHIKSSIIILLSIWILMLLLSIINYKYGAKNSIYSFSFLQNIILIWLLSNDLKYNPKIIKGVFLSFIVGVFMMGTLASFGIGLGMERDAELGTYRLSFFGSNPNQVGNFASLAIIFTIHMLFSRKIYFKKRTLLLLIVLPSLISLVSLSGSRGALGVVGIGFIILILYRRAPLRQKVLTIFTGALGAVLLIPRLLQSNIIQRRIRDTSGIDSLGGRRDIWEKALGIFYDYPLFGKGVTGYEFEMIDRLGYYKDTHNMFLYFMVTGGGVGLFLFLWFLYLLYRGSKEYYKLKNESILLVIFVIYLFLIFKSGGAISSKTIWLLSAIIIGLKASVYSSKYYYNDRTIR